MKVKETERRERERNAKALITSIQEAKEKLDRFGIGTGDVKEGARWILLLSDTWGLEANHISLVARKMKQKRRRQE
ncbi:hypothetical protein D3C80_1761480 [compost metagenome]